MWQATLKTITWAEGKKASSSSCGKGDGETRGKLEASSVLGRIENQIQFWILRGERLVVFEVCTKRPTWPDMPIQKKKQKKKKRRLRVRNSEGWSW